MKRTKSNKGTTVYIIDHSPFEVCDPKEATVYVQQKAILKPDEVEASSKNNKPIPLKPVDIEASMAILREELKKLGFEEFGKNMEFIDPDDNFELYVYPYSTSIDVYIQANDDGIEFTDPYLVLEFVKICLKRNTYKELD